MELKVYDRYKALKATFSPEDNSSCHNEVEGDSYVSVTFTTYECVLLDVGDYILFQEKKYWILESYTPKQEGSRKWNYSVKFYGAESLIKNALMLDADGSPVFAYTAPAREQLALVVKNINRWMGNVTDWKAGDCVSTENLIVDYSEGVYCNEALKKIADEAGTEWWIDGTTVNIGRCEWGDPVTLGYGKGLRSIERDNADNVKFFTRLFPIGSGKNIDPDKYGYSRLQLPQRNAYVEKNTEYGVIEHFEKEAFDGIYPKRVGAVSGARSEEAKDDDGNKYIIYYFSDSELPFDPNDYEIEGLVKHVVFQDGELAGRDFEVNYNSTKKEFEIITTWPYDDDTQLPGGSLIPKTGNSYVLYNLRMPDEYYGIAEREYLAAVDAYMDEHCRDRSVYKAPTDYIYLKANSIELSIGKRVRLESDRFFPTKGYRDSRITVTDRNLNRPGQADIQISDMLSQTSQSKMSDDINGVKAEVKTATTTFPDIVRSWESTLPTDSNLYSARKSEKEFANKNKPVTFLELIRFLKGMEVGEAVDSMSAGKGTVIDKNGRIQTDRIEVRGSILANELIYNRQTAMEGDYVFSERGTIEVLEAIAEGTYLATMRKEWDYDFTAFETGDVVRGIVNNLTTATREYYMSWFRVTEKDTSANTLTLVMYGDSEVPGGKNHPPTALMKLSRWGSATDDARQSCWYLSSYEGRIVRLSGVTKPITEKWNYSTSWGKTLNFLSDLGLPINEKQDYFYARGAVIQDLLRVDYQGKPLMETVDRGKWSLVTASGDAPYLFEEYNAKTMRYENHEVWHEGVKWQCLTTHSISEPRWNSADWNALTGSYSLSIEPAGGQRFFRGSNVYTTMTARVKNGEADISGDITDSQVEWTRISDKAEEDASWAVLHSSTGLVLEITPQDLPSDWLSARQVSYKCKVSVKAGVDVEEEMSINK